MPTFLLPLLALACGGDPAADTCALAAQDALRTCVVDYSGALADCAAADGALCGALAPGPAAALAAVDLSAECADGDLLGLDLDAATDRVVAACAAQADSLAWRTHGGPQAAVWAAADTDTRTCLATAHQAGVDLVAGTLAAMQDGGEGLAQARASLEAQAQDTIQAACPDLDQLVAVDAQIAVERAALQADCLAATVHPDAAALGLQCGPSHATIDAPRGEWTRVPVDPERWPGTVCGDGSDYSFWIRPAPEGAPLDRVLIGLQGGGVCVFEADCSDRLDAYPELFTAEDDEPYSIALVSDDPAVSPFADWTKVYLPYCNQDVFAGGGVVEELGALDLPRAGGVNLRAALGMTRDWLWQQLDQSGGLGYRADQVLALFGGWSAGSYGTLYNYHWILDDLQWPQTAAFPDAGLALDNGEVLGVAALGQVKIPLWGTLPNLPPYCFEGDCAIGPYLLERLSPRLLQVPEQQVLLLSNPRDQTQQADAYFGDEATWINTLRSDFCETRDLPGVHWFLTSVSDESVHVVSLREELWEEPVAGQSMKDWFDQAFSSPDTLQDRAEEADFVDAVPGVEPFPCEVAD